MKTKTFEFKTHEQMLEFLQALDEINESVNEDDLIDYVTSSTEHGYTVDVMFNKYTNELDEYIINNIALKILIKTK